MKSQRIKPGDILKVGFEESLFTYARILNRGFVAFYDRKTASWASVHIEERLRLYYSGGTSWLTEKYGPLKN